MNTKLLIYGRFIHLDKFLVHMEEAGLYNISKYQFTLDNTKNSVDF